MSAYKCSVPRSNVRILTQGHERHSDKRDYKHSLSWRDWTTTDCSQEPEKWPRGKKSATPGPRTAFFAVVWIKWMNIFRPAYFTPRHWRGWEQCHCLGREPSGKKALDEAGERWEEIEGIQLCPSLHEFHRRQMRREKKEKKKQSYKYAL